MPGNRCRHLLQLRHDGQELLVRHRVRALATLPLDSTCTCNYDVDEHSATSPPAAAEGYANRSHCAVRVSSRLEAFGDHANLPFNR